MEIRLRSSWLRGTRDCKRDGCGFDYDHAPEWESNFIFITLDSDSLSVSRSVYSFCIAVKNIIG